MRNSGPFKLNIKDKRLREDMEAEIVRQVEESVNACQQRDDDLRSMDDQMQGLLGVQSNTPWRDACTLDDPLTQDQHWTLAAMLNQALQRDPKMLTDAIRAEDANAAEILEDYLTTKHAEAGYDTVVDHLIYNALRWPVSILYSGYKEEVKNVRFTGYQSPDGDIVEEQFKADDVEYTEVPQRKNDVVVYSGLELRAVDTPDFYMFPADALCIEKAVGCGERMLLTRHQLIDGIGDRGIGLDKDKVYDIISKPGESRSGGDYRETNDDRDGIESSPQEFYELFLWFTRTPILLSDRGKLRTPDYLLEERLLCIVSVEHRCVLRMDFSPFMDQIPYIPHYMLEIPNRFYGWCLPRMLDALQAEANANLQMNVNCMNFRLQPSILVPESYERRMEYLQNSPGKLIPYPGNNPDAIKVFHMPENHSADSMQQWLANKAEKLVSAGGFGSYQPKQRKNIETQAVQQAAFTKFDHILSTFQRGVKKTYIHNAALLAERMDDDGEDFLDESDHQKHITPEMLKAKFMFRPVATSTNTDPATRIDMAEGIKQDVMEWLAIEANPQMPPQTKRLAWQVFRKVLMAKGEHNPDALLGPQPEDQAPAPMPQAPGMELTPMPALQQGMANGNGTGGSPVPMGLPAGE